MLSPSGTLVCVKFVLNFGRLWRAFSDPFCPPWLPFGTRWLPRAPFSPQKFNTNLTQCYPVSLVEPISVPSSPVWPTIGTHSALLTGSLIPSSCWKSAPPLLPAAGRDPGSLVEPISVPSSPVWPTIGTHSALLAGSLTPSSCWKSTPPLLPAAGRDPDSLVEPISAPSSPVWPTIGTISARLAGILIPSSCWKSSIIIQFTSLHFSSIQFSSIQFSSI